MCGPTRPAQAVSIGPHREPQPGLLVVHSRKARPQVKVGQVEKLTSTFYLDPWKAPLRNYMVFGWIQTLHKKNVLFRSSEFGEANPEKNCIYVARFLFGTIAVTHIRTFVSGFQLANWTYLNVSTDIFGSIFFILLDAFIIGFKPIIEGRLLMFNLQSVHVDWWHCWKN